MGHNLIVKCPSESSDSMKSKASRRSGALAAQCSIEPLGGMGVGRTLMSAHSGFNNPDTYYAHPSVNPDLLFKSLASMFIKKSDHQ